MGQDHLEEITRPITGGGDGATSSELTGNAIFIANLGVSEASRCLDGASRAVLEWKSSVEDDRAIHSSWERLLPYLFAE
jgi:hypothetical protein